MQNVLKDLRVAGLVALSLVGASSGTCGDLIGYEPLPAGSVKPRGWMRTLVERNRDGLGGHFGSLDPNQFEKPYATRDYDARLNRRKPNEEIPGWCAEMAGEYRLGQIELALALDDAALRADFRRWMRAAMDLQAKEPDGYFGAYRPGDDRQEGYNPWGAQFALRAMLLEWSATGDRTILESVRRGLRWFADVWWPKVKARGQYWDGRSVANVLYGGPSIIAVASDAYLLTKDEKILTFAEELAKATEEHAFWSPKNWQARGGFTELSLERGSYHTVAYAVRGELPAALSAAKGDANLLKTAVSIYDNHVNRVGWQATYAPRCATEHTSPPNVIGETEYCAFICWMEYMQRLARMTGEPRFGEAIERIVFNGAMGARKKDERAIAYLSSPNQFFATTNSATEGCLPYYAVYAPCLFAACCPAQSIRLIPGYLLNSVLKSGENDLAVLAYGPSAITATLPSGEKVVIEEKTDYPFSGQLAFAVSSNGGWRGNLRLRRPAWATDVCLKKNGVACSVAESNGWLTVAGPWKDDVLSVSFGMKPVVKASPDEFSVEPFRTVELGPLVFAQRIEEAWTEVPPVKPSSPLPKGWSWYEARPARPPAYYAMPLSTAFGSADIEVVRSDGTDYPWENPPVRLRVPMVRASRAYAAQAGADGLNYRPVANPVSADAGAAVEQVEFVPYGATNLRVTCFPLAFPEAGR